MGIILSMFLSGILVFAPAEQITTPPEYYDETPTLTDYRWGNDVRIGNKDSIFYVSYDIHRQSGNLFTALVYHTGSITEGYGYFSSNGGTSWIANPIFGGGYIQDLRVSVSALRNHFYVAFTFGSGRQIINLKRFRTSDGVQENFNNGAQYIEIFTTNPGDSIKEIALVSDQDFENYWMNLFVITTNGSLRYFYSDTAGINWSEIATGVSNAKRGLDACTNEGYSDYYAWATYISNADSIEIDGVDYYGTLTRIRRSFVGPNSRFTSVGAYHDTIIAVYEQSGSAVAYYCKYLASYNGGSSWGWGIPGAEDTTVIACCPDVATRYDGGQGIVYAYNSYSNRRFRYTWRNYYGYWSTPVQFGDYQPPNNVQPDIEYLGNNVYGCIYVSYSPIYGAAYFDRSDWTGIEESNSKRISGELLNISPSPSNGLAKLSYTLKQQGNVNISLYDATGRLINNLINETKPAGIHTLNLSNQKLPNGIYFIRMETHEGITSKPMTIIR